MKKETPTYEFFCEFCIIFKSTYFEKHLRRTSYVFFVCKTGVPNNFPNFTGKRLCRSLFLIKLLVSACKFFCSFSVKFERLFRFISFEVQSCLNLNGTSANKRGGQDKRRKILLKEKLSKQLLIGR